MGTVRHPCIWGRGIAPLRDPSYQRPRGLDPSSLASRPFRGNGSQLPPVSGSPVLRVLWGDPTPPSFAVLLVVGWAYLRARNAAGLQVPDASLHAYPGSQWTPGLGSSPTRCLCGLLVRSSPRHRRYRLTGLSQALGMCGLPCGLRGSLCTLHLVRSGLCSLLSRCNTRYGWLVRPYPVGTSTPQERQASLGARTMSLSCCRTPGQGEAVGSQLQALVFSGEDRAHVRRGSHGVPAGPGSFYPRAGARAMGAPAFALGRALLSSRRPRTGRSPAAAAYRRASEGLAREGRPKDWSSIQSQLGLGSEQLAQKTSGEDRMRWLEAALAAFRQALEALNPHHQPHMWAVTQVGLGGGYCFRKEASVVVQKGTPCDRGGRSHTAGVGGVYP